MKSKNNGNKWTYLQGTYLQNRNGIRHVENKCRVTKGKEVGREKLGDLDWHIHTNIYKIINNDLLYSTGNFTQYSVIAYMGKESIKEWL